MKKSTRNIVITAFSVLTVVLFVLIGVLIYRTTSDDDGEMETVNSNNVGVEDESTEDETNEGEDVGGNDVDYEEGTRTIMVYMIGSDLETESSMGTYDINEMMEAEFGTDIRIVIQTGGAINWHNREIKDGEVQRSEIKSGDFEKLEELGKVNMALGETLTDFIEFAREEYPAEKYTLVMWDHGGSAPISFGIDEIFNTALMTEAEIGEAIEESGVSFDAIIMDACNMCTLEMAMSIRDSADYFVAAESTVIGTGLYYTDWLNYLEENKNVATEEYCELLVKDYMDTARKYNAAASMSYIDLSKVENVYESYEAYVECVYDDIKNGEFVDYTVARKRSGLYSGTDSVDLISLAKKYRTAESSELIAAVKEAVCYTESDYEYGKGLAVYSPNEEIDKYNAVRDSLKKLEYDDELIKCYDAVVSIKYAYMGDDINIEYAGEWYDEEIVRSYDIQTSDEEIDLPTQKINGQDAICLTEEEWSAVDSIKQTFSVVMDKEMVIGLGEINYDNVDADGNIILEVPEKWMSIGGNLASYICNDYYEDEETGEWMMQGTSFIRCNGKEAFLLIQHDNECPNGKVIGYMLCDFDTYTIPNGKARVMSFDEDDEIELLHLIVDIETLTMSYKNILDTTFKPSELTIGYSSISFEEGTNMCIFEVHDVFGNEYQTEAFLY